jgi:hypothetical protein
MFMLLAGVGWMAFLKFHEEGSVGRGRRERG